MIKIQTTNGVEIPFLKETLTLKEVNDAFNDSLTLTYTEFPFTVLETEAVIQELGSAEINSLTSKKEIDITFIFGTKIYFGKLKILKYLENSRSCLLKFGNELIAILDNKIAPYMPVYKYNGEIPYTETVANYYDQSTFVAAIEADIIKPYPQVDYAAPALHVGDYYTNDEWGAFNSQFNYKQGTGFILNRREEIVDNFSYKIKNFNSFVPMPYLMALLKHPIINNGYKIAGSFVDNPFNQQILVCPNNINNNTEFIENKGISYSLNDPSFLHIFNTFLFTTSFSTFGVGTHTIEFNLINIPDSTSSEDVFVAVSRVFNSNTEIQELNKDIISDFDVLGNAQYNNSITFEVTEDNIDSSFLRIAYTHPNSLLPDESLIKIKPEVGEKALHLIHPTVDLSRYVPDWTIAEILNNLKNWQNLEISFNEETKTIYLNYNEDFLKDTNYVDLTDNVISILSKENEFKNKYNISYANKENNVLIANGSQNLNGDLTDEVVDITNKFKAVTSNSAVVPATKEILAQEGVTLLLVSSFFVPEFNLSFENIFVGSFNQKTLDLSGENGIVNTFWKNWINFRQKSKQITAVAYLNTLEILRIKEVRKIYFDNRMYAVKNFSTKIKTKLNEVTFVLKNIVRFSDATDFVIVPQDSIEISLLEILNPNGINSFITEIKVTYTAVGFTTFNGVATVKKLTQDPALGILYDGVEFTDTNVLMNGPKSLAVPLTYDLNGWHEVQIASGGVLSNKMYIEKFVAVIPIQRITLTPIISDGDFLGITNVPFSISFNGISPSEITLTLSEFQIGTGLPFGTPIVSTITDFSPAQFTISSPYSSTWSLKASSGTEFSNTLFWWGL